METEETCFLLLLFFLILLRISLYLTKTKILLVFYTSFILWDFLFILFLWLNILSKNEDENLGRNF